MLWLSRYTHSFVASFPTIRQKLLKGYSALSISTLCRYFGLYPFDIKQHQARFHHKPSHRKKHDSISSASSEPLPLLSTPYSLLPTPYSLLSVIPCQSAMPHWKLILTYDGTPYNGWQVQPNLPTVQGTLAEAIHRITGEIVLPQGSGRTDTGVHALAQVATFSLTVPIPAANLHRALNRALPASIRVLSVEAVPKHFHARHSALRKTYEYRILPCGHDDRICSPMLAPYVWPCRFSLDLTIQQQAASPILGTHDFTSFAANDPDQATRNAADSKTIQDESAERTRSP